MPRNERRTRIVIALCCTMMAAEIAAGILFRSMALVADGLHMSTHAAALLIAAMAYAFARRGASNLRFTSEPASLAIWLGSRAQSCWQ